MMIEKDFLKKAIERIEIAVSDDMLIKLEQYARLLVEWNEKINLTAITEPREIAIKHFADSLLLLKHLTIEGGNSISLIDVGTGAGFPSLPCAICEERIKLTLLDSLNKRIGFLNEVVCTVGVKAECIHGRAEECGREASLREQFDYSTARAVAHLRELSEFCLPFVKVGGCFIALKGYEIEQEIEESKAAIKALGGELQEVCKYELEDSSKRAIVIIKKISQTSTNYPRPFGKMKKQPIK